MSKYISTNDYMKQVFGRKIYKISINGGFTCPNRDGTLGTEGCIFCSGYGSGDFSEDAALSVTEQIEKNVRDDEQLEKEKFAGFEIFDPETRKDTLNETLKRAKRIYANHPQLDTLLEGIQKGFNVACDFINKTYLES